MYGDRLTPAAASVAAVLRDDDLLREIFIRLGFPNYLVRAALVSKRWFFQISDPAFLSRFRDRHPPRLLGICVGYPSLYQFVPLPQPPELTVVSRRAAASCNDAFAAVRGQCIKHCRNGRLITGFFHDARFRYSLLSPLLAEQLVTVLPPTPVSRRDWKVRPEKAFTEIFLPEDGGSDGITLVNLWSVGGNVSAELYVLRSGGWGVPATAATELELPDEQHGATFLKAMLPPVHAKVFLVTTFGYALVLDLATASFFTLELPVGVGHNYNISCADGSGLYLVNVDGFQLSVWLSQMTGGDNHAGGWLLVDTFCILDACRRVAADSWVPKNGDFFGVLAVGENAEFVFLDHVASGVLFYIHLRSRLAEKVYQRRASGAGLAYSVLRHIRCSPFMMSWPPIFPALSGGPDQQE
ncbi:uncharacterized protein LOC124658852 [Lolium rigidum]|uniref:uncharacterized protein LOC124658852 n=1 Tax=Lolium rigidum TaxID=89674 RepID=UPI001F5D5FE4|nr:uncharacterized protein LOC124658852 [Lolium rigidum]